MSIKTVIRAWKDTEFRNSLSQAERAALPANPAGIIELSDAELHKAAGGLFITYNQIGCRPTWAIGCRPPDTSKEAGCPPSTWTVVR
jgi:mersacidin/lichenicidin family type 2 lantibiotic